MDAIIKEIAAIGIVPVIKINDPKDAVPLARALYDGGLPAAEVTFRTACAKEAIERICTELPDMLVGAGTVLTPKQADEAAAAGAKFIVSPGLNPTVVRHCVEKGIPIVPGCVSPSDIERALELNLDTVKFFPAEQAGGIAMIKAMSAPYSGVSFMPTGGISPKNLNDYLSFSKVVACGGSWMVKEELIAEGRFEEITALAREAVMTMLGFELAHVGINPDAGAQADAIAALFAGTFGLEKKQGNSSTFAGTAVEVMHSPGFGAKGHIAFRTNSIERAVRYLKFKGVAFNEGSAKYNAKGALAAIYLQEEFGGFAVHLVQK
ncbi:bifunctional 4-hydroxy-2-oxoglutarate aldolase/2-dehydro-3-deoxy-phosphogluconate aldolase [Acetanaerobacterium elongatum]|uniref:2-dehydro-3-deoxy-phosphogluconate aldolase n=1 Tax=Acetanaerobacterium elongatum TaxID=258515 RepID=A0A1H0C8E4_9FIRM|nr:bifunctional 4-hydroxy-2-oxoglutarate aldolase/2-dehydro-3-deoxy-phosphogluconate aldolase [Acetanaerobacterium elongatum]SDN54099.1 2-dehydro-3-deoxyphosphogluconate aldolase / (4S)-4-hydroxy-2-oxoglutarate aldolase [Acetanaerobacterium elongatum]